MIRNVQDYVYPLLLALLVAFPSSLTGSQTSRSVNWYPSWWQDYRSDGLARGYYCGVGADQRDNISASDYLSLSQEVRNAARNKARQDLADWLYAHTTTMAWEYAQVERHDVGYEYVEAVVGELTSRIIDRAQIAKEEEEVNHGGIRVLVRVELPIGEITTEIARFVIEMISHQRARAEAVAHWSRNLDNRLNPPAVDLFPQRPVHGENGDAESLFDRGQEFLLDKEYGEALNWYFLAAERGHIEAHHVIGRLYLRGLGVQQDYAEAAKWYRQAAEQGFVRSQHNLGVLYRDGLGVPQDYTEAVKWYRLAAEQGFAMSQHNLGVLYRNGLGVPQNHTEAVTLYRLAAEQGHADAQFTLGITFHEGIEVPRDFTKALKWYRLAAEQGLASAQNNLGVMYKKGQGVPPDYAEAVKWYRLAAEREVAEAQHNLGFMYYTGEGVPRDYAKAAKWFGLSAEQGHANAQYNLGIMYANGQGVPRDPKKAEEWFVLAGRRPTQTSVAREPIMEMVKIPAGVFTRGSPASEQGRFGDETQHMTSISLPFLMAKTEVTQAQWQRVMNRNRSRFRGEDLPVERVSWFDAVEFCNKLSELEGLTPAYRIRRREVTWDRSANGYRLPTEAEWEYACRAGTTTRYHTGNSGADLELVGWYIDNSDGRTHPVGQKEANAWGLHDMHGNVWEWCWDWYCVYPSGPVTDPVGPETGSGRIVRGGGFEYAEIGCRSACRGSYRPDHSDTIGFRPVRTIF